MAKEFTAVVPITAKGYRSAAWLYFFAKNRYIAAAYAVGSIGSGLLIGLYCTGRYTDMFVLLCALAVAVSLLMSVILFALRLNKVLSANEDLFTRSLKLRFTPDGFRAVGRDRDAFFKKDSICRVIETKKYIHLYLNRGRAQVTVIRESLSPQTACDIADWLKDVKK